MTNDTISFYCIAIFFLVACCYIIGCAVDMVTILSNLDSLGLAMLPIAPTFSVAPFTRKDRRYSESDRLRNYVGLHTPVYRVLNHAERFILDRRIHRDFCMHTNRGQQKWIYREGVLNISLARGYSEVSIGARQIFAVDEWTRTIYHVDSNGVMHTTDYHQDYDMTDVIAQVTEALEVIAEHYNADKYDAIDEHKARQEWFCYAADNLGVVNTTWKRATVKLWHIKDSTKSVEWTSTGVVKPRMVRHSTRLPLASTLLHIGSLSAILPTGSLTLYAREPRYSTAVESVGTMGKIDSSGLI